MQIHWSLKYMIYLDNTATFWLKPEVVYQTMGQFLRGKWGNSSRGSHGFAVAVIEIIEETRLFLSRSINTKEKTQIIFT